MKLVKGAFIVIEGIDGVGKTEQVSRLTNKLNCLGLTSVFSKTPGELKVDGLVGCCIGPLVRQAMFNTEIYPNVTYESKSLMLLADHLQLVEDIVKPNISAGNIVILDRFMDSQFATWGRDQSTDLILQTFSKFYTCVPNLTILLIGDPEECYYRANHRSESDNIKQASKPWSSVEGLREIQDRYLNLLIGNRYRHVIPLVVKGLTIEEVSKLIEESVIEWLQENNYIQKESVET